MDINGGNPQNHVFIPEGDPATCYGLRHFAMSVLADMLRSQPFASSRTVYKDGAEIYVKSRPNIIRIKAGGGILVYIPDRFSDPAPIPVQQPPGYALQSDGSDYWYTRLGAAYFENQSIRYITAGYPPPGTDDLIRPAINNDNSVHSRQYWLPESRKFVLSGRQYVTTTSNSYINAVSIHKKGGKFTLVTLASPAPMIGVIIAFSLVGKILRVVTMTTANGIVATLYNHTFFYNGGNTATPYQTPANINRLFLTVDRITSTTNIFGSFDGKGTGFYVLTMQGTLSEISNGVIHNYIRKLTFSIDQTTGTQTRALSTVHHQRYEINEPRSLGFFNKVLFYPDDIVFIRIFEPLLDLVRHLELFNLVDDVIVPLGENTNTNNLLPNMGEELFCLYAKNNIYVYAKLHLSGESPPIDSGELFERYFVIIRYGKGTAEGERTLRATDIPPEMSANITVQTDKDFEQHRLTGSGVLAQHAFDGKQYVLCINYYTIVLGVNLVGENSELDIKRLNYRVDAYQHVNGQWFQAPLTVSGV